MGLLGPADPIALSPEGRGVCPSRTTKRLASTAAHLVDAVIPLGPHGCVAVRKCNRRTIPQCPIREVSARQVARHDPDLNRCIGRESAYATQGAALEFPSFALCVSNARSLCVAELNDNSTRSAAPFEPKCWALETCGADGEAFRVWAVQPSVACCVGGEMYA